MAAASAMASVNSLIHANPMSSTSSASGSSGGDGATISANDFLTLLVTEMKNQDPTAQTDPNEYINQLVQVNSLEQLIQINQTLSGAMGSSGAVGNSSSVGSGSGTGANAEKLPGATSAVPARPDAALQTGSSSAKPAVGIPAQVTAGNLSVPGEIPAAHRVAQALSGRH